MLLLCVRCRKVKTHRRVDGRAVCDMCLLRDAKGGKVKDYSRLKKTYWNTRVGTP
ncbi:hypothetical protein LCGC14_0430980 [marine sediment metagenome]|uniref:Uncharacterized protein n=1 Tax=marine sediment metagenome TaxID=412755 RepID=A0A0F9VXI1_9ZZZZ